MGYGLPGDEFWLFGGEFARMFAQTASDTVERTVLVAWRVGGDAGPVWIRRDSVEFVGHFVTLWRQFGFLDLSDV